MPGQVTAGPFDAEVLPTMDAITGHPGNAGVIRSLCLEKGGAASVVAPDASPDPYWQCGSHPEIVERVWDQLGRGFPPASRTVLCGTPVLVHPDTGLVFAVCYGTSYCLRLPDGALPAALQAGCQTSHRWGDGSVTNLAEEFGTNWVFGCWDSAEEEWCRAVGTSRQEGRRPTRRLQLTRAGSALAAW